MAKNIAGITVEIGGDTTKLGKALGDVNSKTRGLQSELKGVESLLKMDPKNVELIAQKQSILNETIEKTRQKLGILKDSQAQVQAQFDKGEITADQYRDFQREIISTEQKLGLLENQAAEFNAEGQKADDVAKAVGEVGEEAKDTGKETLKLGDIIKANLISEAIIGGVKKLGGALKSLATGIFNIGKSAVEGYAETQQLVGGVETIFKDSAGEVQKYAQNAYKTAGVTSNEYMKQVTSFSASLLQSLDGDTAAAAKVADMAIIDMADNANKMGSSITDIQNAYQGFAKQNYTMLDNLKLGYGGTKTEMERLLKDATALSGVEYDINNLKDVYEAIHVIQTELGFTGTTSKEAAETISGSITQMKASYGNFVAGLADENANIEDLAAGLAESVSNVLANLAPVIQRIVESIIEVLPTLIDSFMEIIDEILPLILEFAAQILPKMADVLLMEIGLLIETAWQIVNALATSIIANMPLLANAAVDIMVNIASGILSMLPSILSAGIALVINLIQGISESLPFLINKIVDVVIQMAETFIDNIDLIVDTGIEIILSLVDGIIKALPRLIAKAPEIVQKLVTAITNNIDKIINAAIILINVLVDALIANLPLLIEAASKIMTALMNGLIQNIPKVLESVPKIFEALGRAFRGMDWKRIGIDIINGIKDGITGMAKVLTESVTGVAKAAIKGVKSFLGINSPSRLFRDQIGKMIPQGMAIGIEADTTKAIAAMDGLTEQVVDAGQPDMVNMMNGNPLVSPSAQLESVRSSLGDNGSLAGKIDSMIAILSEYLPHLEDQPQLVLDTGAVVGGVAPGINKQFGKEAARRERGI